MGRSVTERPEVEGVNATLSVTAPLKAPVEVRVRVVLVCEPCTRVTELGADSAKSPGASVTTKTGCGLA